MAVDINQDILNPVLLGLGGSLQIQRNSWQCQILKILSIREAKEE